MDSATKVKIIIFSVFGILILGFILLVINAGSSSEEEQEVSLRALDTAEVSVQDIMAHRGEQHNYSTESYTNYGAPQSYPTYEATSEPITPEQDDEQIEQLQAQLRANLASRIQSSTPTTTASQPVVSRETYTPEPVHRPEPQVTPPHIVEEDIPSAPIVDARHDSSPQEQTQKQKNRFYSGGKKSSTSMINVAVLGDQEVQQGSNLRMVLHQPIKIDGVTIPKGTSVYGSVRMTQHRLYVSIQSIRYGDRIYPYPAQVYDRDGLEGINIVDAPSENLSQEVGDAVAQEVVSSSGVLGSTVGRAINTVSGIFRRRGGSTPSVVIKSNYQLSIR